MTAELQQYFSPSRLAPYLLPGESMDVAFARYQWNLLLAEAMLPTLNYVEIGLRNALNRSISDLYGTDWLLTLPHKLGLSNDDIRDIRPVAKVSAF